MKLVSSRQRVTQYAFPLFLLVAPACLTIITGVNQKAEAQVAPPITPSGLNTHVSGPTAVGGHTQYDITGGTRPGDGPNLFHSFGDFNVPANNIANFLNDTGLPTSNILGRVTGGDISNVFGTIQTTGFMNANLFLMNPAGFLFGPNATVNVGGMVSFTSADYLKLADGARFNAISNATADALLTASPVAAFGFLGSDPGAITVQGSQLTVSDGQGISLVGGNITVQSGTLDNGALQPAKFTAPGGQINLVSVVSPGEVPTADFLPASGVTGGNITLAEGATIGVSGVSDNAAGTVRIRSGSFVMDNAIISADTVNAPGAPIAIDIQVTDNLSISTVDVPAMTAITTGTGNAGEIRISSGSMDVTATTGESFLFAAIDTHTSGLGHAGSVNITTDHLTVTGDPFSGGTLFIDSGTSGPNPGRGGDVSITAGTIELQNTFISTGNFTAFFMDQGGIGTAGNVNITADRLHMTLSSIVTDSEDFVSPAGVGTAGDITVIAHDMNLDNSGFSSDGQLRGGAITINADTLTAVDSQIVTHTNQSTGGALTLTGNVIELTNGSNLVSSTGGNGDAGFITVTGTDHVGLLRATRTDRPSGIFSNSSGDFGTLGNAGAITINTPRLEMTGGARINTTSATSGHGGNVTINATDSIAMSGETGGLFPEPLFSLGTIQPSGIFTLSIGGHCTGPCGNAGNISITTNTLTMGTGSQINSGTSSSGQGGEISINASNTITMSGTLSTGQPGGIQSRSIGADPDAGAGGNIGLTAGQSVTISNGAAVSASSTGPGNTGNIQINAGNQFAMTNSSVTTEASQASGGTIKITTTPSGMVQLTDSTISASVLDGTGGGGSVNIDPQFVILQNSQILANAVQGPGGNIFITTNLLLPDANSVISASSQFGQNGTVTIQSPNAPVSGQIQPLGKTPLIATSLLNQHCAAVAGGQFSSFTVAGRDRLPTGPESWLTSPLVLDLPRTGDTVPAKTWLAHLSEPNGEPSLLSLRQIAPAGFLTQAFAVDQLAGCAS